MDRASVPVGDARLPHEQGALDTVVDDGSIPKKEVLAMIDHSYDLVYKSLSRADKEKIERGEADADCAQGNAEYAESGLKSFTGLKPWTK
jgi:hypothetical protein